MLRNQQIKSGSEGTPAGHEGFDVESAEASFPKEESKLNNAISIGNTRLPIVDAIRVLCSFIIICAHLDMLFRKESNTHRRLEEDDDGQTLKVALKCITGTVVQGFFNLSGFVVAYQFLTNRVDSLRASLLSRPFRMLIPLALVQIVDLGLYLSDLAYFNYQSKPSWETVQDDFSSLRFVFASSLNGPLWVIEAFFFLPYAIFPILSATMALRLSKKQRIHLFLLVSFLIQCLVEVENNFMDRLVAGMLGVVCACYLQGDDAEEIPTTAFPSTWLVLGFTLPWNPLIPVHWRVPLCRVGAPCAIVLFHHVLRRRYRLFQGLIDKLSHAGPYTFQVYIWHHVVYGWAGKSLLPYLTNDVFVYQVVCIPLVWAIVGAISVLMYKYVESPVAGYVKVKYINNHTRRNPTKEILSFDVDLQRE